MMSSIDSSQSSSAGERKASKRVSVFISYAPQDGVNELVLSLSNILRSDHGIDCWIDQYFVGWNVPISWLQWLTEQLTNKDWILSICTEQYYNQVMGRCHQQSNDDRQRFHGNFIPSLCLYICCCLFLC